MIELHAPTKLEIREAHKMGLGVFATDFINKGEVVEDCKVLPLPISESGVDILPDYRFNYPARQQKWEHLVVALGMGSMYNHSDKPNIIWENHPTIPFVFRYVALKDIYKGEQCFIYYGNVQFP